MKWAHHPNLRKRPPTPAKARGSIQRAIRRAFCNGNGMYWITPKGRHVEWPGGRFV
jgi:hypothetical protein